MKLNEDARAALDALDLGIVIIDHETRIVYANASYRDFAIQCPGATSGPVMGRLLRDVHPQSRLQEVLEGNEGGLTVIRGELEAPYAMGIYPIRQDQEITGGVAVILPLEDASLIRQAVDDLERQNRRVLASVARVTHSRVGLRDVVGESPDSRKAKALARKAAARSGPLLLEGPCGVGKGFYAQVIHNSGPRRSGVLAVADCGALDREALDRELFGLGDSDSGEDYEMGLLEAASGGTLYLREIERMPLPLQQRLLNAIKNRRFCPPGSRREIPLTARIIAGTNIPREKLNRSERFHNELLQQLSPMTITIPPLSERPEDVPILAQMLMRPVSAIQRHRITVSLAALQRMVEYSWPGNVQEMKSVLEYAAYRCTGPTLRPEHLPEHIGAGTQELEPLCRRTRRFEQEEIRRALRIYGTTLPGKKQAAAALGISLASLYNKMKEGPVPPPPDAPETEPEE